MIVNPPTETEHESVAKRAHVLVNFPNGIPGFDQQRDFRLTEGPGAGLYWLRGVGTYAPSFLLSDPFVFFDDFELELPEWSRSVLDASDSSDVIALTITTPSPEGAWTVNLCGPLVLNLARGLGTQTVVANRPPADLRHPFMSGRTQAA